MKTKGMMKFMPVLAAALLALAPMIAEAAPAAEVAAMSAGGAAVTWQPQVADYDRMVLTVSGPGGVVRQEFKSGEAPSFSIFDAAGFHLADGSYTWELRVVPRGLKTRTDGESGLNSTPFGLRPGAAAEASVQSGAFAIRDGALVAGGGSESETAAGTGAGGAVTGSQRAITAADQVIADDLIVDGSACIGFDCVNGESFGFDTLRLKENNVRIKFQDTSSTASFPDKDWQLTANDTTNGGQNKFSIDDVEGGKTPFTIEFGARSHSLYVDDGGRVGLGTSTPVVELHVVDGDSPTLRLEQNGSSGFTPQTWDIAGNETNYFIRDVTNGSKLPFRIRPGAPTSSIDVAATGNVGIGTSSPDAPMHILRTTDPSTAGQLHVQNTNGTATDRNMLRLDNNGPPTLFMGNTNAGSNNNWTFTVNNSGQFTVNAVGSGLPVEMILAAGGNMTLGGTLTTGSATVYPDYVFEPDYPLMPLDELSAFVREHRHLPGVTSAEVVEKTGQINVSELQLQMLEKLEELTLYTLSLDQENVALKARLAALEANLQQ